MTVRERESPLEHIRQDGTAALRRERQQAGERKVLRRVAAKPGIEHRPGRRFHAGTAEARVAQEATAGGQIGNTGKGCEQVKRGNDDGPPGQRWRLGDLEHLRFRGRATRQAGGRQQHALERATHLGASRPEPRYDDREARVRIARQPFGGPARRRLQFCARIRAIDARQLAAASRQRFDLDIHAARTQALDKIRLRGRELVEPDESQWPRYGRGVEPAQGDVGIRRVERSQPLGVTTHPEGERTCLRRRLLRKRSRRDAPGVHPAPGLVRCVCEAGRRHRAVFARLILDDAPPHECRCLRCEQATPAPTRAALDVELLCEPGLPRQHFKGAPDLEALLLAERVEPCAQLVGETAGRREQYRARPVRIFNHASQVCINNDLSSIARIVIIVTCDRPRAARAPGAHSGARRSSSPRGPPRCARTRHRAVVAQADS